MNRKIKSIKLYSSSSLGRCVRDYSSTHSSLAEIKILFITSLIITFLSFSSSALAAPEVVSYKLNGKEESARLNPYIAGSKVKIEITNPNQGLVKFKEIDICPADMDNISACDKETRVRHYYTTTDVSSVTRDWNGKTSDTSNGVIVPPGDYKIKITIDGESSRWLSPHIITIDSNFSGGSGGSSSESSSSTSQNSLGEAPSVSSDTPSSGSSSFISTHSSPEELSAPSKSSTRFEASSGRDRLAYSGAPIAFNGEAVIPKGSEGQGIRFVWSFGDGSVAESKKVSHTYKFAGDYIVVLNVSLSDLSAISRTSVKVINPSVAISNISGDSVEIWNKGIFEINLNGWLISNNHGKFIFPTDTIIGPNKKIAFPDEYMKLNLAQGGKVSLLNPSQKEISAFAYGGEGSSSSPTLAVNSSNLDNDPVVMKIRDFIAKANKVSVEGKILSNKPLAKIEDKLLAKKEKVLIINDGKTVSSSTQTAAVISSSGKDSQQGGFIKSILSLPSSGLGFIVNKFYSGN